MSLSARAIAVSGIGFSALLVSVSGLLDIPATPVTPTVTPDVRLFGYAGARPAGRQRADKTIQDNEDIIFILSLLERENLL